MPSIIPGYLYSIFAALLVGAILVTYCNIVSLNIRVDADRQQLRNIANYVATESLTLLSHGSQSNQNITQYIDIPSQVGNQRYWLRIANDSSNAWVESGFGSTILSSDVLIEIPVNAEASGSFVSGSGRPTLQCHLEGETASLTLTEE